MARLIQEAQSSIEFTKLGLEDLFWGEGTQIVERFGKQYTIHEINAANMPFSLGYTLKQMLDKNYPTIEDLHKYLNKLLSLHLSLPNLLNIEREIKAWHAISAVATVGSTTSVSFNTTANRLDFVIERGPQGAVGPEGPQGTGVSILDFIPAAQIYAIVGADRGDAYISSTAHTAPVVAPGDALIWNGSSWINAGPVRGPRGLKGDTGPQGIRGLTGLQGPQGVDGIRGPQGLQGSKGDRGHEGPQGPSGPVGPAGTKGLQGLQGPRGSTGNTGLPGNTGIQGLKGDKGDIGHEGPQGIKGDVGTGIDIKGTVATHADLPTSSNKIGDAYLARDNNSIYIWGSDGDWHEIAHLRGPEGQRGPIGLTGHTGPQGPVGPVGPTGQNGNDGVHGVQGSPGVQGQTGAKGDIGIQGPIGLTGPQGATGPQGPNGNKGAKGDTGAQGTAGTGVTIKGTNDRAHIEAMSGAAGDMWIINDAGAEHGHGLVSDGGGAGAAHWTDVGSIQGPRGDKGVKGDDGPLGPKGDSGAQGSVGHIGPVGPKGPTGPTGQHGAPGPHGDPGQTGAAGAAGSEGPQGIRGEKGDPGATGPIGHRGTAIHFGNTYKTLPLLKAANPNPDIGDLHLVTDTGSLYVFDNILPPHDIAGAAWHNVGHVQGPVGPVGGVGPIGKTGPQGSTGANGSKGDKGDPGPRGLAGATGPTGPVGHIGKTGATGPVGHKGDPGTHGTNGAKGATGARGPQGSRGLQGIQGQHGAPGHHGATGPARPLYDSGWHKTGTIWYRKLDKTVYVHIDVPKNKVGGYLLGTLPAGYRPNKLQCNLPSTDSAGNVATTVVISTNGQAHIWGPSIPRVQICTGTYIA